MLLPNAAWVIVADGQKHLILENCGDPDLPDLRVQRVEDNKAHLNSDMGTDRPGRTQIKGGRRAAMQQTDWRALGKTSFATDLAHEINREIASGAVKHFVLIADPRTIGTVRSHLAAEAAGCLLSEISGDFTHQTIGQIEQLVVAS